MSAPGGKPEQPYAAVGQVSGQKGRHQRGGSAAMPAVIDVCQQHSKTDQLSAPSSSDQRNVGGLEELVRSLHSSARRGRLLISLTLIRDVPGALCQRPGDCPETAT
jgi:hypothetical protein